MTMDDIPGEGNPSIIEVSASGATSNDKKRQSDEYNNIRIIDPTFALATSTTTTPSSSSTPQRSTSLKKTSSPRSGSDEKKPVARGHARTQSIHLQPKKKYPHARRGSLPPLQISSNASPNNNKLAYVDFGSPIRSPFGNGVIPPLPEKLSIQIPHPSSELANVQVIKHRNVLQKLIYIGLWYLFSTSLSLYNKNLMGKDRFNFNFPLLLSAIHAGLHALISAAMMSLGGDRWNPKANIDKISTSDYIRKVVWWTRGRATPEKGMLPELKYAFIV
ncbi:hypothetical protein BX666DRAFT_73889 [Dichotomocladium elegans]|nr:hypothetical protein BX666DRAFT_73889 [Dichotomocladium elegans]